MYCICIRLPPKNKCSVLDPVIIFSTEKSEMKGEKKQEWNGDEVYRIHHRFEHEEPPVPVLPSPRFARKFVLRPPSYEGHKLAAVSR